MIHLLPPLDELSGPPLEELQKRISELESNADGSDTILLHAAQLRYDVRSIQEWMHVADSMLRMHAHEVAHINKVQDIMKSSLASNIKILDSFKAELDKVKGWIKKKFGNGDKK